MTVLASRVLEDTEQETARLSALKQLAPEVAQRMTDFLPLPNKRWRQATVMNHRQQ